MPRSTHLYAWVGCRHYFLLSFVDAYSRYVVHHRLLIDLTGRAVATELEAALGKCEGARPRIVHDHGSEFCNSELRAVVKAHDLLDIRTRARHPESNGIVERFNGTVRRAALQPLRCEVETRNKTSSYSACSALRELRDYSA